MLHKLRHKLFRKANSPEVENRFPGNKPTTVLHISDLHSGFRFDNVLWLDLLEHAKKLMPDVIVITGDVVNTPWQWAIRRVLKRLTELRMKLRTEAERPHLEIFVVPGNHDTRVSGLFPVSWLAPTSLGFCATGAVCLRFPAALAGAAAGIGNLLLFLGLVLLLLRLVTTRALRRGSGKEFFIEHAKILDGFNVGVIPFDSASVGVRWAAGKVKRGALRSFVETAARYKTPAESMGIFWIAAVHHHPVPLPYDDANEQMMIMTNAGKFLHELASHGVPLILHGHKHHQHYSKLSFRVHKNIDSQISVLSASTPTEKGGVGMFRHGFNVIRIDEEHRANVSIYSAEPASETFCETQTFVIADSAEMRRRRYMSYLASTGIDCKKATFTTVIDSFGDAIVSREFFGFRSQAKSLRCIPAEFKVDCSTGHIGAVKISSASRNAPHINFVPMEQATSKVRFRLEFEATTLAPHVDIDFTVSVQGNNMFALNADQASELYPRKMNLYENMEWTVPEGFALKELLLVLQFEVDDANPNGVKLSRAIGESDSWIDCEETVNFVPGDSSVSVMIMYPRPKSRYRLTWRPIKKKSNQPSAFHTGRARGFQEKLVAPKEETRLRLSSLLLELKNLLLKEKLFIDARMDDVRVALFSYNETTKQLCLVASDYDDTDERSKWSYGYGLGLPGRAFKLSQVVAFDKGKSEVGEYLRGDNTVATDKNKVQEGNAFAFPLCFVDENNISGPPFGVFQISIDGWGGQIAEDEAPEAPNYLDLQLSLSQAIQSVLEAL